MACDLLLNFVSTLIISWNYNFTWSAKWHWHTWLCYTADSQHNLPHAWDQI